MPKEFKEFAMRGNVLDMAIGIILGAAFGKVITSLVSEILMPPIGMLLGHVDFSSFFINLSRTHYASMADAKKARARPGRARVKRMSLLRVQHSAEGDALPALHFGTQGSLRKKGSEMPCFPSPSSTRDAAA